MDRGRKSAFHPATQWTIAKRTVNNNQSARLLCLNTGTRKTHSLLWRKKTTLKQSPCFCFCKTEKALGTGNNRLQQEWFFQTLICQRTAALQLSWMVLAKHLKGIKEDANIWRQIVTTGNLCRWLNNRGERNFPKCRNQGWKNREKPN